MTIESREHTTVQRNRRKAFGDNAEFSLSCASMVMIETQDHSDWYQNIGYGDYYRHENDG